MLWVFLYYSISEKFRIQKLIIKMLNNFSLKQSFVFWSYSVSDPYKKMFIFKILHQRTTIDML
jgi:hypothetical protein